VSTVFLLVAEDTLCANLAMDLCDRAIAERAHAAWLRDQWEGWKTWEIEDPSFTGGSPRRWRGFADAGDGDRRWSKRGEVPVSVRVRPVPGEGGHAALARKAMLAALRMSPAPTAVVIAHDTQGDAGLRERIRAAVDRSAIDGEDHVPVLLAIMHQESNAWLVAGFVPDAQGTQRREDERQRLGFDPVEHPHRLTPGRSDTKKDAKRVCGTLLFGEAGADAQPTDDLVRACWRETPLDTLEHNGNQTGLPEFLVDVATRLLPTLGDHPGRRVPDR